MRIKKFILGLFCSLLLAVSVQASAGDGFKVSSIHVQGLVRIDRATVLNYLPMHQGQYFKPERSSQLIRALYDTGFFKSVRLKRKGNALVIQVVERETIGSVAISGNSALSTSMLKDILKKFNLVRGRVFQRSVLDKFKKELKQQYIGKGHYNARVTTTVTTMKQNRVAVKVAISEGRTARIKEIKIFGNSAVKTSEILGQFHLTKSSALTYITKKDQYSKYALDASLQALTAYYLDRGYLKFKIISKQVLLSTDKEKVYINIRIHEGPQYHLSGYSIKGKIELPRSELNSVIKIKAGDVFSRTSLMDSISAIGDTLGNAGYGFPAINAEPAIDEKNKTIFIVFRVNAGRHVYVRRINFTGNTKTGDYVLRHVIKQDEGSILSLKGVKESERQLKVLGFLKNVSVKTVPVKETNNQVDLHYSVEEAPSAEATAALGYGTNGIEFNASFNQRNFVGTGRTLGINFNTSYWGRNYGFNYYNPYYTRSGIGRGVNAYYQTADPKRLDISTYTSERYGFAGNYNIPVSDTGSIQVGLGLEHLGLTSLGSNPSTQSQSFVAQNGSVFNQIRLTGGWNNNSYDQVPYPTKGLNQQLTVLVSLPSKANSLSYFKTGYSLHGYYPIKQSGFIVSAQGSVAYGNTFNSQGLPFYENYFAGGISQPGQIRGYDNYSVGPNDSVGNALGGNLLVSGSAGLILPYPLSRDSFRTSGFVDFGNVWAKNVLAAQQGTPSGPLRSSYGVSVDWRSPFGPLAFSLARPIKKRPQDKLSTFQFTVSSGF